VRHALKHSPGRYLFAGAVLSCAAVTFLWWFARQKNSRNTAITTGIIAALIGGAVLVQIWADRFTLPQRRLPPGPPRLDSTPPPVNEAAPEAEPSP
jgi:hypothetical protein